MVRLSRQVTTVLLPLIPRDDVIDRHSKGNSLPNETGLRNWRSDRELRVRGSLGKENVGRRFSTDVDVTMRVDRDTLATFLSWTAGLIDPLDRSSRIELGKEDVVSAHCGHAEAPEHPGVLERARDKTITRTIHKEPIASVGAGTAENAGEKHSTGSIKLHQKTIVTSPSR